MRVLDPDTRHVDPFKLFGCSTTLTKQVKFYPSFGNSFLELML